jgi:IS4 transposase
MARAKSIGLRDRLTTLLPHKTLWGLARETGFVVRSRKIEPPAFLWTLVFGFAFGGERTLAALRRAYETATRKSLVPSAFRDRFDASLVRYVQAAVGLVLDRLAEPTRALAGELAAFKEVLVTDATVVRLHDFLAKTFPGCRTNHTKAALKLHVVMRVNGNGPKSVKVTSERKNDGRVLQVGKWVRDRLLLFDLGYYRYQLFDCIRRNGGYFLTRLKNNANPTIVAAHRRWRGASVPLVGQKLQDVIARLQREEIDVDIEVQFKRRKYAGKRSSARQRFRLVGLRNDDTGGYHLYVTNLPADRFDAKAVAAIYRARWTIEMLFKSLKSDFALDQMPSRNKHAVLALVYAAILTWVASRELLVAVRELLADEELRVTQGRWTRLLRTWAAPLLLVVTSPPRHAGELARAIEFALLVEAPDPHRTRMSLGEEVEHGIPFSRRAAQVSRGLQPT